MTELSTILDWIRYATSQMMQHDDLVYGHGSLDAFSEAHTLVLGRLHLPFEWPEAYLQARLTQAECTQLSEALAERIEQRRPTPYIIQRARFMGLDFYVDERVLIPRSPIAELVEVSFEPYWSPDLESGIENKPVRILDLCCGSGCIGIACAYTLANAEITLADISADALAVAQSNIDKHGVGDVVHCIESDLFAQLSGERFDIIVSNPPYVDADTMSGLPSEFLHEPELALASGETGLDCTRQILLTAADYLNEEGVLVLEVGASWDLLTAAFPDITFHWHTFQKGGEGVFVMSGAELRKFKRIQEGSAYA